MLEAEEVDGKKKNVWKLYTLYVTSHMQVCHCHILEVSTRGQRKKMPFLIVNKQKLSKVLHMYLKFIEMFSFQKGKK